ncbi:MAG: hypothetical protein ACE5I7_07375, partial [Candidatus Binatia bacterium]
VQRAGSGRRRLAWQPNYRDRVEGSDDPRALIGIGDGHRQFGDAAAVGVGDDGTREDFLLFHGLAQPVALRVQCAQGRRIGGGGTSDADFVLERLYGDLEASDSVNLRVGKFLTPVGRWNVIHAQPLVWTTSRPLATEVAFDRHTTGATLFGSVYPRGGTLTYSLFGQFVDALEPTREVLPAGRSAGGRLEYSARSGLSVAATYLASSHHGDWQHLGGLDALWQRGPLELMSEWVFAKGTGELGDAWGGYVQSALEVLPSFYLVDRYEHFDQRAPEPEVNLVVLGAAYKPLPHVILKAEYLIADHPASESPPGFKASLAFLF